jgi:hypothetical protein
VQLTKLGCEFFETHKEQVSELNGFAHTLVITTLELDWNCVCEFNKNLMCELSKHGLLVCELWKRMASSTELNGFSHPGMTNCASM